MSGTGATSLRSVPDETAGSEAPAAPAGAVASRIRMETAKPAFRRDPRTIAALVPVTEWLSRYHDFELRGTEHLPQTGPCLIVANHSGGMLTPDTAPLIAAWYRANGVDAPLHALTFDLLFALGPIGSALRRLGCVPANGDNASAALDAGDAVLVYPGGDWEAYRPFWHRNRIDFGGRTGFVRLALEKRVPVVPVVSHGGHASTLVFARGDRIARATGLSAIRAKIFPLHLTPPWTPLPAKIVTQICAPIDWSRHRPGAADDPGVLQRCYDEITREMQATLDALAAEIPFPVAHRIGGFVRSLLPGKPDDTPQPPDTATARVLHPSGKL